MSRFADIQNLHVVVFPVSLEMVHGHHPIIDTVFHPYIQLAQGNSIYFFKVIDMGKKNNLTSLCSLITASNQKKRLHITIKPQMIDKKQQMAYIEML